MHNGALRDIKKCYGRRICVGQYREGTVMRFPKLEVVVAVMEHFFRVTATRSAFPGSNLGGLRCERFLCEHCANKILNTRARLLVNKL